MSIPETTPPVAVSDGKSTKGSSARSRTDGEGAAKVSVPVQESGDLECVIFLWLINVS